MTQTVYACGKWEMDAEKRSRLKEEECGREISDLRWAVRSSSVMQAPRGDLSSGMLAVTRVLVLKRTCLTGCLQPRQKTILQYEMCTFILVHVSLLVHIVPEANVKMSGTTLLENVQILILSLTCDTKLMFSNQWTANGFTHSHFLFIRATWMCSG